MKKPTLLIILWIIIICKTHAQQLLNGSFEGAALACGINLSNPDFTNKMPDVVGFGEKNELDILSASCNYGPPQQGIHFVALTAKAGITDAIGMRLSEPLIPGQTYTLQFYEKIGRMVNGPARLSVGIANTPTSHGELLHTVFELHHDWTRHSFQFKPPINGEYLTVIVETGGESWIFVDNFSVICPLVSLGADTTCCNIENIILQVNKNFDYYIWNDQSAESSLTIQEPGTYWVEAKSGGCTVRDTIQILENPLLCFCKLYLPNSFSPNDDGTNDVWQPLTHCEIGDYELIIFDRWGSVVFQTTDPEVVWDGKRNQKEQAPGMYIFKINYTFKSNNDVFNQSQGLIYLVR